MLWTHPDPESAMNKLLIAAAVVCALFTSGCDRKPTDMPKPKTSVGESERGGVPVKIRHLWV
jgi:hypothetical protein